MLDTRIAGDDEKERTKKYKGKKLPGQFQKTIKKAKAEGRKGWILTATTIVRDLMKVQRRRFLTFQLWHFVCAECDISSRVVPRHERRERARQGAAARYRGKCACPQS